MTDYFRQPAFYWWMVIPPALLINFLSYYSPNILHHHIPLLGPVVAHIGTDYHWITVITNLFALFAHIGESLYAIHLCQRMNFSLFCCTKWFVQTFVLGFPSLSILTGFVKKHSKR
ncbi:hypothetical protein KIN20_013766 [Parelaphostrongylus tenuis]|uniref:Transmembrane protein 254 n=1 Tax=Parelaphostrongylus tenuis TaxID=148309 RepID=A0AAD5MXZ4_PARTN|nr:hypothetical protein KIN20_013766 [Parelaphostrongylus tenuis]